MTIAFRARVRAQISMAENPELLAWSGTNSGPVVAWNDEKPIRRRERKQQRFKSPGSAQRFLNVQSVVYNNFYVQRHLLKRATFKQFRSDAFDVWESASATA